MSERITGEEATVALESVRAGKPSQPSLVPTAPGYQTLGGRYEIIGLIGAGGMGTVYRARDIELDEVVALKLLCREHVESADMLERFRREVKLARRVTHRNVARTFDIGEDGSDKFLTMEFVDGEALSSRLSREGALPLAFTLEVARDICAGLAAAHEAGVIHRDLKPDNVLVARDGRIVLTDFGIARAAEGGGRAATLGMRLGTPAYMAPEQVEGAAEIDARADIYALGTMLYECMTGERAFGGENVWAVAAARLIQPPPDPRHKRPDVPDPAAEIVLRCMARRPEDRFTSAGEVADALTGVTMPPPVTRPAAWRVGLAAPAARKAKTVAVFPFKSGSDKEGAYIADGLSDDLVDALTMTGGLRVLPRGAVESRCAGDRDLREVGKKLGADVVVDGSVRRGPGAMLRVSVRVISVEEGFQLWAKRFDRPERDVLAISDEAANAIAEALTVHRDVPARPAPDSARALDLYLRAKQERRLDPIGSLVRALPLIEEAVSLAPEDPTILAGYAHFQLRRFVFAGEAEASDDAARRARAAANAAIAIAPHVGEARAVLAQLDWASGDANGCARQLRDALRVAPMSAEVNELLGRFLIELGRPKQGLEILSALAALGPLSGPMFTDIQRARALLGDWSTYDDAVASAPSSEPVRFIGLGRLAMWRRDRAAAEKLRERAQLEGSQLHGVAQFLVDLVKRGELEQRSLDKLDERGRVVGRSVRDPVFMRQLKAEALCFVGRALEIAPILLECEALGLVDISWMTGCPMLAPVREEAWFVAIRERIATRAAEALALLEGK